MSPSVTGAAMGLGKAMAEALAAAGSNIVIADINMEAAQAPGTPDELQGIVLYLASDSSSFVTGTVFSKDGGYTVW